MSCTQSSDYRRVGQCPGSSNNKIITLQSWIGSPLALGWRLSEEHYSNYFLIDNIKSSWIINDSTKVSDSRVGWCGAYFTPLRIKTHRLKYKYLTV